ncbi:4'-phosphopantetheinyl transferase family protein [Kitasatospora sp. McL0602]|uniref:4'-phosphopantetheinyl transferase family protein n=1 Tax=Kitasatospora sp. McL0602 TaxID=3439530 RepID=UPI003F8A94F2
MASGPVRIAGPGGPWEPLFDAVRLDGTAVAYGTVADWQAPGPGEGSLERLLGRETARYLAFDSKAARLGFAASRRFLKHVAGAVVGAVPEELELAHRPHGGVYIRGVGRLGISLSHTEDLVVVGVSRRGAVGTDVESATREVHEATAVVVCSPAERAALKELPEPARGPALLRLWTLKEAYSKAIGQGMRFPFTQFGFDLDGDRPRLRWPDGRPRAGTEWQFASHTLDEGYLVSLAVSEAFEGVGPATVLDPDIVEAVRAAQGHS